MVERPGPPGQSWATFLRNHADGICSVDLFIVPTIGFRLLYCLVILSHSRRMFIHHAVTAHPTAEWIARQIIEAFPWNETPRDLLRDRAAVCGEVVKRRLRGLGIRDRPIAPRSPWQNAYVERWIGSARRECIDHMIVFDETQLRRVVSVSATWSNHRRAHGRRPASPIRPNLVIGRHTPGRGRRKCSVLRFLSCCCRRGDRSPLLRP